MHNNYRYSYFYNGKSDSDFRFSVKPRAFTVGSKIIRALEIILAIFLWFDCQFLSSHACYKQYKAKGSRLDKYLFDKAPLGVNFLTRIISVARLNLLPTVVCIPKYIVY